MPLQIKLFAADRDDQLNKLWAKFEEVMDTNDPRSVGRIKVEWELRNSSPITQLNVNWFSTEESLSQRKTLDPSARFCFIPVTKPK